MKEHSNDRDKAEQSAHQRKNRGKGRAKRVWGVIGTIVLVGVLTMAIFVGIFMTYINKSLKGHVEVDMSEYDRKVSTELYRLGTDGETWEMYQTLFSDENRIWWISGTSPSICRRPPSPSRTSASRPTTGWTGRGPCGPSPGP